MPSLVETELIKRKASEDQATGRKLIILAPTLTSIQVFEKRLEHLIAEA
jgi:hypothetical protein